MKRIRLKKLQTTFFGHIMKREGLAHTGRNSKQRKKTMRESNRQVLQLG